MLKVNRYQAQSLELYIYKYVKTADINLEILKDYIYKFINIESLQLWTVYHLSLIII